MLRSSNNKRNLILLFVVIIIGIVACNKKKESKFEIYDIYQYDNKLSLRQDKIQFLDSLIDEFPNSEYAYGMKIKVLSDKGQYKQSLDLFNQLHTIKFSDNYFSFSYFGLGYRTYKMKDLTIIKVNNFKKDYNFDLEDLLPYEFKFLFNSIQDDQNNVNMWVRKTLAEIYDIYSNVNKSNDLFEEALSINPYNAELLLSYSEFLIRRKNDGEYAISLLNKIPKIFMKDSVENLKISAQELLNNRE